MLEVIHWAFRRQSQFNREVLIMSEYFEQRKIAQAVPVGRHRVVDSYHDQIIHEPRGMSGGAITALVISAVALTVMVMMLISENQQRDDLAQDRAAVQQAAQQYPPQQAPVQTAPQPAPTPTPAVVPPQAQMPSSSVQTPSSPTPSPRPYDSDIEAALKARLQNDKDLHSYSIEVDVSDGTATLRGELPSEELKIKAEQIAMRVKGVLGVVNEIDVHSQS